jgi:hypothetical protein
LLFRSNGSPIIACAPDDSFCFRSDRREMNGVKLGIDNIPNNKSAWFCEDYVGGGNGDVTWAGKDNEARGKAVYDVIR